MRAKSGRQLRPCPEVDTPAYTVVKTGMASSRGEIVVVRKREPKNRLYEPLTIGMRIVFARTRRNEFLAIFDTSR